LGVFNALRGFDVVVENGNAGRRTNIVSKPCKNGSFTLDALGVVDWIVVGEGLCPVWTPATQASKVDAS